MLLKSVTLSLPLVVKYYVYICKKVCNFFKYKNYISWKLTGVN